MRYDELKGLLTEIDKIQISGNGHCLDIYIPAIQKEVTLFPNEVILWNFIEDPFGNKALMLLIFNGIEDEYKLIIGQTDFVFNPLESSASLGFPDHFKFTVRDMPPIVCYSEMARDFSKIKEGMKTTNRLDHVFGCLILLRYFLNGAERVGIDCQDLVQEWRSMVKEASLDRVFNLNTSKQH